MKKRYTIKIAISLCLFFVLNSCSIAHDDKNSKGDIKPPVKFCFLKVRNREKSQDKEISKGNNGSKEKSIILDKKDTSDEKNGSQKSISGKFKVKDVSSSDNKVIEGRVEAATDLNIDECIMIAMENNPQIMLAIANKDIYKTKIGQAWANYFPKFSVSTNYTRTKIIMPVLGNSKLPSYNYFQTVNASVDQLVFDFGKTKAQADMAKRTYESTQQNLEETINDVIYNVKSAYYYLLYTMQQEKVLKDTVEAYELHLDQAKGYYEIGVKAKIDVITAEHELSNARLNHIKSKNLVDIAYAKLNNALGVPEKAKYGVKDILDVSYFDINFEKSIEQAYNLRPQLLAAKKQLEASQCLVRASKYAFLPDLNVSASYYLGGKNPSTDYGYTFGGSLQYQPTNLYLLKKQVDEAKATAKKDQANYTVIKQNLYLEVKQAYINMMDLQETIPVSKLAVEQAKEQYDLANGRYKVGLGNSIEFKDAQTTYQNAKLDYYKSLLDYNTALAQFEKVVGAPLKESSEALL